MRRLSARSWLWHHRTSFAIIGIAVGASIITLGLQAQSVNYAVEQQQEATRVMIREHDAKIAELTKERETREAEAKQAAEVAKTATPETPQSITCQSLLASHNNPANIDVIVNKSHCLSPLDYTPTDLVSIDGYLVSAKIAPQLQKMMAAAAADGVAFGLTSAYRSYANQVTTYGGWVEANGSVELADTVSARPGYSEHQTGLAVDLDAGSCVLECFAGTPQYTWLQAHAAEYGFIQRYYAGHETTTGYSPEAWHYRYIGRDAALDMQKKGIKTLEEYWGVKGGNYPS